MPYVGVETVDEADDPGFLKGDPEIDPEMAAGGGGVDMIVLLTISIGEEDNAGRSDIVIAAAAVAAAVADPFLRIATLPVGEDTKMSA